MITWVVERLTALLGHAQQLQRDKREVTDTALRAVSDALTETCLYYRDIESGTPEDKEREARLVRLWASAAIPLRHVDSQLAAACQHKSEYWLNPRSWDRRKAKSIGIDLENMRTKFADLLTQ